ncbi:MAG: hydrolase [bacterium]
MRDKEEVCCPEFNPSLWDNKEFTWTDKLFIKGSMRTFLHMPLPSSMSKLMTNMWDKIIKSEAQLETKDMVVLTYDPTLWKSENYFAVSKEVEGAENVKISGQFLTKVFDGPYSAVPKWMKEMDTYVQEKGNTVKKYYMYYTTCPKCAKKYGHNYVVCFAEIN